MTTEFDLFWANLPAAELAHVPAPAPAPAPLPRPTANAEAAFALLCSTKPLTTIEAMLVAQAAMATA